MQRRLEHEGVAAFEAGRCYLEAARMLGIRRAVVSASVHTPAMMERAGLAELVDGCVDGNTIEAFELEGKPAPDTVLEACHLLDVPPARAASFETTAVGIEAARAAGMGFVVGVGHVRGPDLAARELGALFMTS